MPELHIERRQQPAVPWWVWLVGALLLALLIWWIVAATTPDRRVATTQQPAAGVTPGERVAGERQETTPMAANGEWLPIQAIHQNPDQYHGDQVSGMATVAEVVSNRGFWVERDGERLFVVDGQTTPPAAELRAGQQVRLQGFVYRSGDTGRMPQVEPMDERTARVLQEQRVFMHVTGVEAVTETEAPGR